LVGRYILFRGVIFASTAQKYLATNNHVLYILLPRVRVTMRCMNRRHFIYTAGLAISSLSSSLRAQAAAPDYSSPGRFAVHTALEDWRDAARDRTLPVKLFVPQGAPAGPVIVFSHGLGGSRQGGTLWSQHWASHGYTCVNLQHPGSDASLWEGLQGMAAMRALLKGFTPENTKLRIADARFAINLIASRSNALIKNINTDQLGMVGHSYGGRTTMAISGEREVYETVSPHFEPRIKASVVMSPAGSWKEASTQGTQYRYGGITQPHLSITGTKDTLPFSPDESPETRKRPFQHMKGPGKYLLMLEQADHMVFGGGERMSGKRDASLDAKHVRQVQATTLAFWNAHLKGDARAQAWLESGANQWLGADGKLEAK
jgi:dienelactone hydrolase